MKALYPLPILAVTLLAASCASKTAQREQRVKALVANRIAEQMGQMATLGNSSIGAENSPSSGTAEADSAEPPILPITFRIDRLAVGDLIILRGQDDKAEEATEPSDQQDTAGTEADASVEVRTGTEEAPFEKVFSIGDVIATEERLTEKERETLATRSSERLTSTFTQVFPVEVSRLEMASISRLRDEPEASEAAIHLIKNRRNLQLEITSGLDQLIEEELPSFLQELETMEAKELMTDSTGRTSPGNFRAIRNNVSEMLAEVRERIAAGEEVYIISKVGFAEEIGVTFDSPVELVMDEDMNCLAGSGKAIFASQGELNAAEDRAVPEVRLSRAPRIFWGFVGYRLVENDDGTLTTDTATPLQLDL